MIWLGLFTLTKRAGTPPKVTVVAPANPEPRIVAVRCVRSDPPNGITAVMLGTTLPALVSTYSNVEAGPGALDSPPFSVTITSAGPAPSCGAGASGGSVWRAGGNVAVIEVGLSTVKRPGASCAAPTSTRPHRTRRRTRTRCR